MNDTKRKKLHGSACALEVENLHLWFKFCGSTPSARQRGVIKLVGPVKHRHSMLGNHKGHEGHKAGNSCTRPILCVLGVLCGEWILEPADFSQSTISEGLRYVGADRSQQTLRSGDGFLEVRDLSVQLQLVDTLQDFSDSRPGLHAERQYMAS
jgi:hypothetical protein